MEISETLTVTGNFVTPVKFYTIYGYFTKNFQVTLKIEKCDGVHVIPQTIWDVYLLLN